MPTLNNQNQTRLTSNLRRPRLIDRFAIALLAATACVLSACSKNVAVTVLNQTDHSLSLTLRVDRVGSRGTELDRQTVLPGLTAILDSESAPPLEYIELAVQRSADRNNVAIARRVPRGGSTWTIDSDAESWAGFAINPIDSASAKPADSPASPSPDR